MVLFLKVGESGKSSLLALAEGRIHFEEHSKTQPSEDRVESAPRSPERWIFSHLKLCFGRR